LKNSDKTVFEVSLRRRFYHFSFAKITKNNRSFNSKNVSLKQILHVMNDILTLWLAIVITFAQNF